MFSKTREVSRERLLFFSVSSLDWLSKKDSRVERRLTPKFWRLKYKSVYLGSPSNHRDALLELEQNSYRVARYRSEIDIINFYFTLEDREFLWRDEVFITAISLLNFTFLDTALRLDRQRTINSIYSALWEMANRHISPRRLSKILNELLCSNYKHLLRDRSDKVYSLTLQRFKGISNEVDRVLNRH